METTNIHTSIARQAHNAVRSLFQDTGWDVVEAKQPDHGEDFVLTNTHGQAYHAVLKTFTEGRSDRVTAFFAQALLEARSRAKKEQVRPAVLIWVNTLVPSLVNRLVDFHRENGDGEPFVLLSAAGVQYAEFPGLNLDLAERPTRVRLPARMTTQRLVFSDLTQWMLKLLLAVDIKRGDMFGGPAVRYSTATDLARAAGCSVNTATRLVNALRAEGFIESGPFLNLVQRRKLVERWKAQYQEPALSLPMKFLAPMPADAQLPKLLQKEGGVLGLFAAAKALGVGHVHGVPPTVWVPNLMAADDWRALRRAREGERPDLIMQQHSFPLSLARGAVVRDGMPVTDIIQTWLDVSAHPSRGAEQAAELEHGILANVIGEGA
ncbi:hypothetical protein [Cupriavidus sp. UYPR2.512]|uniref:hypothetical protein n=1 Tax=Cupriavidus sp. UYPR2.512 TaxID=1080187 RepID=UPI00037A3D95|nr:hypothetical protein [Cupriavidus sp. UYPR2.512]UIF89269.1 RpiR family transcriptional regulator [Cupriavidus necator]